MFIATSEQLSELEQVVAVGTGLRRVTITEAETMLPALRKNYLAAAAVEDDAFDMDVSAIHQGFLRQVRAHDGVLALRARDPLITLTAGTWHV